MFFGQPTKFNVIIVYLVSSDFWLIIWFRLLSILKWIVWDEKEKNNHLEKTW